jgi:tetratricopeptide (TPR) repeat protein
MKRLLSLGVGMVIFWGLRAQDFHNPAEIVAIMKDSRLAYTVMLTDEQVAQPDRGPINTAFTYQKQTENGLEIAQYEVDSLAFAPFQDAEAAFKAKNYSLAREKYGQALEFQPDLGIAATYIGQCYREEGNRLDAGKWFERAIEINFFDYLAHWFWADILLQQGKKDLAAREISLAWVLNRNHPKLPTAVAEVFKATGRSFQAFDFVPNYQMERVDDEVKMRFSEEWTMYVLNKALWRFEPGYHHEMGGGRSEFDMTEEKECLLNLMLAFKEQNGNKKSPHAAIQAMLRAMDQKMMNAFIFMEEWLPQQPLIVYTQPRSAIEELAEYVLEIRGKKK